MSAWVSVVIPTFNGEKYLETTLQSIVAQNDKDIECLLIDDGSQDETLAIAERFQAHLSLNIIDTPRVGNWVVNTNKALHRASGRYLCFLHQDDFWLPGRSSVLRQLCEKNPDVNLILGPALFVNRQGKKVGRWQCPFVGNNEMLDSRMVIEKLLVQNCIAIPAPIFTKETIDQVGDLNEHLWYTADWDFWIRLVQVAGKIMYYPEPLVAFRVHGTSQTVKGSMDVASFRQQLDWVVDKYLACVEGEEKQASVSRIASFSIEVNTFLAAGIHGRWGSVRELCSRFHALSWTEKKAYFKDSGLRARVVARLLAGLVWS